MVFEIESKGKGSDWSADYVGNPNRFETREAAREALRIAQRNSSALTSTMSDACAAINARLSGVRISYQGGS